MRSTRRLPVALGAAALAVAVLGACSGSGTSGGSASDGKSVPIGGSGSTVSPAPPGKYQTLPEPCSAVDPEVLKALVPAAKDLSGTESLTYDTDRRVGCSWTGRTAAGTSDTLSIDLERVVSYDPAIGAEEQARADYDQQAAEASIPPDTTASPTTPSTPTSTATPTSGDGTSTDGTSANGSPGTPDLLPRRLPDVGNAAFINDVLKVHSPVPRRDVTLVFRTANVLVRITYSESSPRGGKQPSSADLQKGAQQVADELERKVEH